MCGRFALFATPVEVGDLFDVLPVELPPRYNIAPTQSVLACRADPTSGARELLALRWGLVPSWAKDLSAGVKAINARAETVADKPTFRAAFKVRRCLIPASGYYEWKHEGKAKRPYFIHPARGGLFAFAGLWDVWQKGAAPVESCSILTTTANEATRHLHDRRLEKADGHERKRCPMSLLSYSGVNGAPSSHCPPSSTVAAFVLISFMLAVPIGAKGRRVFPFSSLPCEERSDCMNLLAWLENAGLALRLAPWQQFGLAFLLGSFAVATLSDLKRLSAQREFVEVWLLFALTMLVFDGYECYLGHTPALTVGVKWGLIAVLSLLSLKPVGMLFRLAPGDVAALAAAAGLLTPALVVIFYGAAKLIALAVRPLLARGRPVWPFMPVVSLATLVVVGLGWCV